MTKYFVLILSLIQLLPTATAEVLEAYTMPRTQVIHIKDSQLNRQYELFIKLPEDYQTESDTLYPVIYTTDAKWHLDLLSGVSEFLMPNVILVGISWQTNMSEDIDYGHRREFASRFRDYSFTEHEKEEVQAKYNFGGASDHLRFIRTDVIKYIENQYRADPKQRSYIGYSMGGEFGAYILLVQSDTFQNYILGSPSVDSLSITFLDALEKENRDKNKAANVFVSIGELENKPMAATKDLVSILTRNSNSQWSVNGLEVIEQSDHATAVPDTFVRGVRWLTTLNSK